MEKSNFTMDETDKKILTILKNNARMQWREIGDQIHLSGQAVGERVRKLTKHGIIQGYYTAIQDIEETTTQSFITVIMTTNNHQGFLSMCDNTSVIKHVYKTSGHGCYLLITETNTNNELDEALSKVLVFGNYQVNTVIKQHK